MHLEADDLGAVDISIVQIRQTADRQLEHFVSPCGLSGSLQIS